MTLHKPLRTPRKQFTTVSTTASRPDVRMRACFPGSWWRVGKKKESLNSSGRLIARELVRWRAAVTLGSHTISITCRNGQFISGHTGRSENRTWLKQQRLNAKRISQNKQRGTWKCILAAFPWFGATLTAVQTIGCSLRSGYTYETQNLKDQDWLKLIVCSSVTPLHSVFPGNIIKILNHLIIPSQ